ncbi:MAG TPA: hypothetical protein VJ798_12080 [Rhizomicrobium sp.]|nr:hypothetical protein [Rhizomicrobium sp.]
MRLLLFLWILGAIGVAYGAKLCKRGPLPWFVLGMVLTPVGGILLLQLVNRLGWFSKL